MLFKQVCLRAVHLLLVLVRRRLMRFAQLGRGSVHLLSPLRLAGCSVRLHASDASEDVGDAVLNMWRQPSHRAAEPCRRVEPAQPHPVSVIGWPGAAVRVVGRILGCLHGCVELPEVVVGADDVLRRGRLPGAADDEAVVVAVPVVVEVVPADLARETAVFDVPAGVVLVVVASLVVAVCEVIV